MVDLDFIVAIGLVAAAFLLFFVHTISPCLLSQTRAAMMHFSHSYGSARIFSKALFVCKQVLEKSRRTVSARCN